MGIHWDRAAVADLCIFIACCALFLGYHLWLFVLRPLQPIHRKSYFNISSAAHKSRCARGVHSCARGNAHSACSWKRAELRAEGSGRRSCWMTHEIRCRPTASRRSGGVRESCAQACGGHVPMHVVG